MDIRTDDEIREFIILSHWNLDEVKKSLAVHPDWLPVYYDWGEQGGVENAIGAAAHVGNQAIAQYLLEQGAEANICVWATLGREDKVKEILDTDPQQANAMGAHDIPVLFHAATYGSCNIAEMLRNAGCRQGYNFALHGAVNYGHADMVKWLLDHGVTDANTKDFQGKTPLEKAKAKDQQAIIDMLESFQPATNPQ